MRDPGGDSMLPAYSKPVTYDNDVADGGVGTEKLFNSSTLRGTFVCRYLRRICVTSEHFVPFV